MSELTVSYIHSQKCKKAAKLEDTMNKELKKAGKAKNEPTKCKVTKAKVLFKGKKEVILRSNIETTRKNKENKIIVVAAKGEKNETNVYAIKFPDDENFTKFYDALTAKPDESITEKQPPSAPRLSITSAPQTNKEPEALSRSEESHVYNNVSGNLMEDLKTDNSDDLPSKRYQGSYANTVQSRSPSRANSPDTSRHTLQPKPPTPNNSHPNLRLSIISPSPSALPPSESPKNGVCTASYITTDALDAPKRSSQGRRQPRKISPNEVYPIKDKQRKSRSKTEINYLNYVPGKGMVKSGEGNVYLYSSRIRNASESSSTSSSSNSTSSSSTSDPDVYGTTQVYRLVPMNRSGSTASLTSLTSESSFSSFLAKQRQPRNKVNVWQLRNHSVDSSSSSSSSTNLSKDIDQKNGIGSSRSRPQNVEYVECPTCHRRSKSRIRVN